MTITRYRAPIVVLAFVGFLSSELDAMPQFARQYKKDCSYCHLAPPVLNLRGEIFLANGYRLADAATPVPSHRTVPVSAWNTMDYERRYDSTTNRGFLGRVELISAGPIGKSGAAYFAEWRLVSQQIASGNTLLDRSGRFEDLFVTTPIGRSSISVTGGQFRAMSQVDVSRRLSISEPQVFNASLPGKPASTTRETALRAFSPAGRQPGVRVMWHRPEGDRRGDGWYAGGALLFPGELTIPMTDAASFEVEGTPKGVLLETYRRSGLGSIGGHVFLGDDRQLALGVGVFAIDPKVIVTAAGGVEASGDSTEARVSLQTEFFFHRAMSVAGRVEDRTGTGRRVAGVLTFNAHLPFGPDWFRQAFRLQVEQRIQTGDRRTQIALSHVF